MSSPLPQRSHLALRRAVFGRRVPHVTFPFYFVFVAIFNCRFPNEFMTLNKIALPSNPRGYLEVEALRFSCSSVGCFVSLFAFDSLPSAMFVKRARLFLSFLTSILRMFACFNSQFVDAASFFFLVVCDVCLGYPYTRLQARVRRECMVGFLLPDTFFQEHSMRLPSF